MARMARGLLGQENIYNLYNIVDNTISTQIYKKKVVIANKLIVYTKLFTHKLKNNNWEQKINRV